MSQTTARKSPTMKPPYWVKASWIMEATGWDKRKLQRAREQKVVITKMDNAGYLYDLNSIHESLFINKKEAASTTNA